MDELVESRVDRLIREATARGEFEDLAGSGKPLPGAGTPDDELWWVRAWLARIRLDENGPEE
jgi:hypothetical protein